MIENKNTGQRYIGQSIHIYQRWKEHINSPNMSMRIDRAIKKHGADNFELKIICKLEQDDDLLNTMEEYYIWKYNTFEDNFHYNLTPGGEAPMRNRHHTNVARKKMSEAHSGKKFSEETRKKMSKAKTGENHPMYRKKFSEEHRKNLSEARNTTGYYRVNKCKCPTCKNGFRYRYEYYYDDGKKHQIYSVDIKKLEKKVKAKGLEWFKLEE